MYAERSEDGRCMREAESGCTSRQSCRDDLAMAESLMWWVKSFQGHPIKSTDSMVNHEEYTSLS